MKILHATFTKHFYGSEHYCAQLALLQAEAGHEVRVLIKNKNPVQVTRFKEALGNDKVIVIPKWWPALLDGYLMKMVFRGFKPDVLHTHLGRATQRGTVAAHRARVPHVASLHMGYNPKRYAKCDGILCVASWQLPTLKGFRGVAGVVRNWVPELWRIRRKEQVMPAADRAPARSGERQRITLGSVGRLDRQKGYDILIPAFQRAFPLSDGEATADVRLVLVGEGPEAEKLRTLAAGDPRIELVGYQANVPIWLEQFDAFVSSSRFEGLALVVLEAMGAGLPLLLTSVAGNAELADLQTPGLVTQVPPEDGTALSEALRKLVMRLRAEKTVHLGQPVRISYDLQALDRQTVVQRVDEFYAEVTRNVQARRNEEQR